MLCSPSKMSLLGIHLVRGSDCREEGSCQMLVSEQKVAGRRRQDSFLVWTSRVSLAFQWQVPPIA